VFPDSRAYCHFWRSLRFIPPQAVGLRSIGSYSWDLTMLGKQHFSKCWLMKRMSIWKRARRGGSMSKPYRRKAGFVSMSGMWVDNGISGHIGLTIWKTLMLWYYVISYHCKVFRYHEQYTHLNNIWIRQLSSIGFLYSYSYAYRIFPKCRRFPFTADL